PYVLPCTHKSPSPDHCCCVCCSFFFFFQAEDGIRDWSVTGVQTCALPIWPSDFSTPSSFSIGARSGYWPPSRAETSSSTSACPQIGRASCRERVEISVVAVSLKKKRRRWEEATESVQRDEGE